MAWPWLVLEQDCGTSLTVGPATYTVLAHLLENMPSTTELGRARRSSQLQKSTYKYHTCHEWSLSLHLRLSVSFSSNGGEQVGEIWKEKLPLTQTQLHHLEESSRSCDQVFWQWLACFVFRSMVRRVVFIRTTAIDFPSLAYKKKY